MRVPQGLVCVVDDEESVRTSIGRLLLSARLSVETFASASAYLDRAPYSGPSCLVLDVWLPDLNGIELQERITGRGEQIIFMSGRADVPLCARAMRGGGIDFLTKPIDGDTLISRVLMALERSAALQARRREQVEARTRLALLTPREFDVLRHVIGGCLNKQIADQLGMAEKTVKIHRSRVMEKMLVYSVPDLVRAAQSAGVAPVFSRS